MVEIGSECVEIKDDVQEDRKRETRNGNGERRTG